MKDRDLNASEEKSNLEIKKKKKARKNFNKNHYLCITFIKQELDVLYKNKYSDNIKRVLEVNIITGMKKSVELQD